MIHLLITNYITCNVYIAEVLLLLIWKCCGGNGSGCGDAGCGGNGSGGGGCAGCGGNGSGGGAGCGGNGSGSEWWCWL